MKVGRLGRGALRGEGGGGAGEEVFYRTIPVRTEMLLTNYEERQHRNLKRNGKEETEPSDKLRVMRYT